MSRFAAVSAWTEADLTLARASRQPARRRLLPRRLRWPGWKALRPVLTALSTRAS